MQKERLIRLPEVKSRVGYGKSQIYALIKMGKFPHPIRLQGGRAVAWPESQIDALVARLVSGQGARS